MVIYTMCVDAERGRYMAISTDDPDLKVLASSAEEALGILVRDNPGIKVDNVCSINTNWH